MVLFAIFTIPFRTQDISNIKYVGKKRKMKLLTENSENIKLWTRYELFFEAIYSFSWWDLWTKWFHKKYFPKHSSLYWFWQIYLLFSLLLQLKIWMPKFFSKVQYFKIILTIFFPFNFHGGIWNTVFLM